MSLMKSKQRRLRLDGINRKAAGKAAVAVLSLAFFSLTAAYAQAPAGPNRPPEVPEGYVITPFGYFHPSCVLQLAEGETLLSDGRIIQHADGTLETLAVCSYPHYTARGEMVIAGGAGGQPPTISHSWIESADVTTSSSYGELSANWTVPPKPSANHGQTLYFFPGLEDTNDVVSILQPVLGWNSDFGSAWGIASWNCCPSGITVESSPVSVSSGDKIQGTIKSTCSAGTLSCSKWNVTTKDVTTGKSTKLSNTPSEGQTFNWAFAGAVEVYNVVKCGDYPSNGALSFSSLGLYNDKFVKISSPSWSIDLWASGLTPQCSYGGTAAAAKVTLDY
ncbi:MAG TPA: hypothetical protein VMI94_23465 [Bryobacteraceae bacterium]|nr:hypothetical protein [Bryobacteraceae bacterium]